MTRKRLGLPRELTKDQQKTVLEQIKEKYKIERGPTRVLRSVIPKPVQLAADAVTSAVK